MGVLDGIVKGGRKGRGLGETLGSKEYPWEIMGTGDTGVVDESGKIILESTDPDFRAMVEGLAGGQGAGYELYGGGNRHATWELSPEGQAELARGLRQQIKEPKRFKVSKKEMKWAKRLLEDLGG